MSIKTLLLVGALSFAATSAVQAEDGPGNPTDNTGRSHATAAPAACGYECPVLAGVAVPAAQATNNGRSGARMASDGPSGPGDTTGRSSAALSIGDAEFLVASIRGGSTGDF